MKARPVAVSPSITTAPWCVFWMKKSHCSCSFSPPVRISSGPVNSTGTSGIRSTPSGVNSDARRARSRIIAASVNSLRSASISTRSAIA